MQWVTGQPGEGDLPCASHRHYCLWILNTFCLIFFFPPEEWRVKKSEQNNSEDPSTHAWELSTKPVNHSWVGGQSISPALAPVPLTWLEIEAVVWLSLACTDAAKHVAQDSLQVQREAPCQEQQRMYYLVCYTRLTFISFGLFCCLVQWRVKRELSSGASPKWELKITEQM